MSRGRFPNISLTLRLAYEVTIYVVGINRTFFSTRSLVMVSKRAVAEICSAVVSYHISRI